MGIPKTRSEITVDWFNKNLKPKEIKVSGLTWSGAANNGLGALSSLERVKLILQDKSTLSLIIKSLPTDPKIRDFVSTSGFASREVNMYTRVFKDMEDFLTDRKVSPEYRFRHPMCYYGAEETVGNEYNMILILEDMIASNYDLWMEGPFEMLDWERTTAALRQLAIFHAVTFAYRQVNEIKNYIDIYPFLLDLKQPSPTLDGYLESGLKVIREMFADGQNAEVVEMLVSQKEKFKASILKAFIPKPGNVSVICHNDVHSHNVAFLSKDKSMEATWFDFQVCVDSPPMKDVTFFLLVSCDFSLSSTKMEETLSFYHKVFTDALHKMSVDTSSSSYSLEQMKRDFERNLFYSVWRIVTCATYWGVRPEFLQSFKKLLIGIYELGFLTCPKN